jgi:hypothetical protein
MPMIAITTNNSTSVKPQTRLFDGIGILELILVMEKRTDDDEPPDK